MSRMLRLAPLVPLLYFGALFVTGALHPGYSHMTRLPSDLGAVGAPHAAVFNVGIILMAVALLVSALALAHAARALGAKPPWYWGVGLTLGLTGIYFLTVGLFPLPDPRHNAAFPLALGLHLSPFLLAGGLRHRREHRTFCWYLVVTGMAMLLLLGLALGGSSLVTAGNIGGYYRLYALVAFSWIGVAGVVVARWLPGPVP